MIRLRCMLKGCLAALAAIGTIASPSHAQDCAQADFAEPFGVLDYFDYAAFSGLAAEGCPFPGVPVSCSPADPSLPYAQIDASDVQTYLADFDARPCAISAGACCFAFRDEGVCFDGYTAGQCAVRSVDFVFEPFPGNELSITITGGIHNGDGSTCSSIQCPPPPPTGACCDGIGGCTDNVIADECDSTWSMDTQCTEIDCSNDAGACCLSFDNSCEILNRLDCLDFGAFGSYLGDGTDCANNACVFPPRGACCLGSQPQDCLVADQDFCENTFQGNWQGEDTNCDDTICADDVFPGKGACCVGPTTCLDVEPALCESEGGQFQGLETTCATVDCSSLTFENTGACCTTDASCFESTQENCPAIPGYVYSGDGTDCLSVVCDLPTGACCDFSSGVCIDDLAIGDCQVIFGISFIGQTCDQIDCPAP